MKKFSPLLTILIPCVMLFLIMACEDDGEIVEPPPATYEDFQFLIFSDVHVDEWEGDSFNNFQEIINKINNGDYPEVPFIMLIGDLVNGLDSTSLDDYPEDLSDFDPEVHTMQPTLYQYLEAQSTIPIYETLGKNDYRIYRVEDDYENILATDTIWEQTLNMDLHYSFTHKYFRFIVLNPNRGPSWDDDHVGSFDDDQMDWLEEELAKGEPVFLFSHFPPITDNPGNINPLSFTKERIEEGDRFYDIVEAHKDSIKGIFCSHVHVWGRDTLYDTIPVYTTGASEYSPETNILGLHGDEDYTNNYHLVQFKAADQSIEVIMGDPKAQYIVP